MQTAAGIPLHTNGAERDIRRLARETVNENLPVAIGEGFYGLARRPAIICDAAIKEANRDLRAYPEFGLQASRLIGGERCSEYQRKKT